MIPSIPFVCQKCVLSLDDTTALWQRPIWLSILRFAVPEPKGVELYVIKGGFGFVDVQCTFAK